MIATRLNALARRIDCLIHFILSVGKWFGIMDDASEHFIHRYYSDFILTYIAFILSMRTWTIALEGGLVAWQLHHGVTI
jgi:hypothetical protein